MVLTHFTTVQNNRQNCIPPPLTVCFIVLVAWNVQCLITGTCCSSPNPVGQHTKPADSDTTLAHNNDRVWEPVPEDVEVLYAEFYPNRSINTTEGTRRNLFTPVQKAQLPLSHFLTNAMHTGQLFVKYLRFSPV